MKKHFTHLRQKFITILLILMGNTLLMQSYAQNVSAQIGTLVTSLAANGTPTPYNVNWTSSRTQYLILASELNAAGIVGAKNLLSISFNVAVLGVGGVNCTGGTLNPNETKNLAIKVKNTSTTVVTGQDNTGGFTTVYSTPSYIVTSTGWNTHSFSTPFAWDGVSNVLVDICHDNTNGSAATCYASGPGIFYTTTGFNSSIYYQADGVGALCTTASSTGISGTRATMQFTFPGTPMTLDSVTTVQVGGTVPLGSTNAPVVGIVAYTTGQLNPRTITRFNLSANGTTDTNNISNAKIFYTGTSNTFAATNQFGSAVAVPGASFNINGSRPLATGANYFWLTYNITSNPAATSSVIDGECTQAIDSFIYPSTPLVTAPVGSRTLLAPLSGNYSIGATGTYTTITQALQALNSLGATGPVTFSLLDPVYTSATETFPLTINAYPGMSFTNSLTIRPDATASAGVAIYSSATSVFTVNGAKYVKFEGRLGGTGTPRSLTIQADVSGSIPAIVLQNDAIGTTIQYCNIRSSNTLTTGINAGSIYIGGSTAFAGNDSITIQNNYFSRASVGTYAVAVFSYGQSNAIQNNNISILNNEFNNFTYMGVSVVSSVSGNGSYFNVSGNSFYDTLTTTAYTSGWTAINLAPSTASGANYYTVSNNYIGGQAALCGGSAFTGGNTASKTMTGIALATATGPANTVYGNTITNIAFRGTTNTLQFTGITVTTGSVNIDSNTIGHPTNAQSIVTHNNHVILGINATSASVNMNITRNIIANIYVNNPAGTTARLVAMNIGGSGAVNTVSGNQIYGLRINSSNTGTTTTPGLGGIMCSGSGTNNISGNQIGTGTGYQQGLIHATAGTALVRVNGMYCSSGINNITGNTINGLIFDSTAVTSTSTTTTANMLGICDASGTAGQVISGNTVTHIQQRYTSATQVSSIIGILYASSGSSTISGNTVYGVYSRSNYTGTSTSAAFTGIMVSSSSLTTVSNNYIDSIVINSVTATLTQVNGITVSGAAGSTTSGNVIKSMYTNSTATNGMNGIYHISAQLNLTITGNKVYNLYNLNAALTNASVTTIGNIVGIRANFSTTLTGNTNVLSNNFIHSFKCSSTTTAASMFGIEVDAGANVNVNNNIVRLGVDSTGTVSSGAFVYYGIFDYYSSTTTPQTYYHNSVYIGGTPNFATANYTACHYTYYSSVPRNIKNNILYNASSNAGGSMVHAALKMASTTNMVSNNNMLYAPGTNAYVVSGPTNYTALGGATGWVYNSRQDGQSGSGNPNFVTPAGTSSSLDMSLSASNPCEMGGDQTVASIVSSDYNGATRSSLTPTDLGAIAGNNTINVDVIAPAIVYAAFTNTASSLNRVLTATITDNMRLVDTSTSYKPRVYFRKNGGTWFSTPGELSSGTISNGTWTFTIDNSLLSGVIVNDQITYFVVAQDSANNISSNPLLAVSTTNDLNAITSYPSILNSYNITSPLPTSIVVGPTGTYTTLTGANGAFQAINNGVLQGNTTIFIQPGTISESPSNQLNQWLEINGTTMGNFGYTLTIRPQTNTKSILSGTYIGLNGADRVNIIGWDTNGTSNDTNLVITNTIYGYALMIQNDACSNNFSNVIFEGNSYPLYISGATVTGNDNLNFTGCKFRGASTQTSYSVYIPGTTGKENDSLLFNNCQFYNYNSAYGMYISGCGNMIRIKNSHFFTQPQFTTSTYYTIYFAPGAISNLDTISGNYFGGSAPFAAGSAQVNAYTSQIMTIYAASVGSVTGVAIMNNVVKNITYSAAAYGYSIYHVSGPATITGNMIGDTASVSPTGINWSSTSASTSYGIYVSTSSPVIVNNNYVSKITNASIYSYYGIYNGSGVTQINNNLVQNISNTNAAGSSVQLRGIYSASATITQINNNTIRNFTCNASNTSTTTSMAVCGIMNASATALSISNNTVVNLSNTYTAAHVMCGIYHGSGVVTMNGNTVENLYSVTNSTGTTTSCGLTGIFNSSGSTGSTITNNVIRNLNINTVTPASTQIIGMMISSGAGNVVTGNLIQSVRANSTSASTTTSSSVIGMYFAHSGSQVNLSNNIINTLENTYNAAATSNNIIGLYYSNSATTGTNTINANNIHSLKLSTPAGAGQIYGLYIASSTNAVFSNNLIRMGIDSSGSAFTEPYTVNGIYSAVGTINKYYHNNVYIGGAPPSTSTANTYAIRLNGIATAPNQIKNNIFVNAVNSTSPATGMNFGIYLASAANIIANSNIYFTPGTNGNVGQIGASIYATFAGASSWLLGSGMDYQSGYGDPQFINATGTGTQVNLRLQSTNPAEGMGDASVALDVATDVDGNTRSSLTPADIGASAGNYTFSTDIYPPQIIYSALGNTGNTTGPLVFNGVNIVDPRGIYTTGTLSPRLYYRKGLYGTPASVGASGFTGTSRNAVFSFSFDYSLIGGVVVGDTIFYLVIAQDSANNIMSSPAYAVASDVNTITVAPVNPNAFYIVPAIPAGTKFYVGNGQTYTSLTNTGGLFAYLNGSSISGSVTAVITSDISGESGTNILNSIGETGTGVGTYTLTIRPDSSATGVRTVEGSSATALLRLNGADRVKITGVPDQSGNSALQYLRIRNSGNAAPTIQFSNGAQGNRISNTIIEGANALLNVQGAGVVNFGAPSATEGNSWDSLTNCIIRNDITQTQPFGVPTMAVQSSTSSLSVFNSNNYFDGNSFMNMGAYGINTETGTGNNWIITNNHFFNDLYAPPVSLALSLMSIRLNAGLLSEGHTITGNYIGGQAANAGGAAWVDPLVTSFQAFVINIGNSQTTTIANNVVRNINMTNPNPASLFYGIQIISGRIDFTGNTIGDPTNTSSITTVGAGTSNGIVVSSVPSVPLNITNNSIQGIFVNSPGNVANFVGMNISGGVPVISNNTIGHASTANSIRLNGNGGLIGIQYTTTNAIAPTIQVTNNTIANLAALGTQSGVYVQGIGAAGSAVATITGNSIYALSTNSTNTSSGAGNNIAAQGIRFSTSGTGGHTIAQNQIYNISADNTGNYVTGSAAIAAQGSVDLNITRNRIYDIRNLSTTTAINPMATATGILLGSFTSSVNVVNNQITLGSGQTNNAQFNGIWVSVANASMYANVYYNSVLVTGSVGSGSVPSYAFHRGNNTTAEITTNVRVQNNAFIVDRFGGSSKNYAIANEVSGSPVGTGWSSGAVNYNALASPTASVLGRWGNTDQNILTWRTISGADNSSYTVGTSTGGGILNTANLFTNISTGDLSILTSNVESHLLNGKGTQVAAVTGDYANASGVRSTDVSNGSTDIGSIEFNTASNAPDATTVTGSHTNGGTEDFFSAGRRFASITWGGSGTIPAITGSKYWTQKWPNDTTNNGNATLLRFHNSYVDIAASGGSGYTYDMTIYYDDALMGTVSGKNATVLAKKQSGTPGTWTYFGNTSRNNANNSLTVNGLTGFSEFAGVDTTGALIINTPIISGMNPICAGNAGSYNTSNTAGHTYTWNVSGGAVLTGQGTSAITVNWGASTSGTITVQDSIIGTNMKATSAAFNTVIHPVISSNTVSGAQSVCNGSTPSTVTGSAPAGGNGTTYSYTWLSSTTSATAGFTAATGTNNTINYGPGALGATTWYRRYTASGACSDTTTAVQVAVTDPIAGNSISGGQFICSSTTPSAITGSTPTGGNGSSYTYAWISSTNSATSGFAAASGTNNTQSYTPGLLSATTWFRRIVTSGACAADTTAATQDTVTTAVATNSITSGTQTICTGSTPSTLNGSTPTGGDGTTYSYAWISSTTSATSGFAAAGGTDNTQNYSPGTLTATTWYRRVVASGLCGADTSAAVQVTITIQVATNTASGAQTICSGNTPSSLTGSTPTGGNGSTYTYSWISSTTSALSGFAAAGGTNNAQNYSAGSLIATTWYRRIVSSGACDADTTASVQVTVNPVISGNTISSAQSIYYNTTPSTLTGSTPTGGDGSTYAYNWISSTTGAGSGYSAASGTNNTQNYSPAALTVNTWYRRITSSGTCIDTSSALAITVYTQIATNTISGSQNICTGSTPSTLTGSTPTGGSGTYAYSWLSSTTSGTSGFALASGTNNAQDYSSGSLTATTWYRRAVASGGGSDTSAAVQVTVNPVIATNTVSAPQTICSGNTPSSLSGSTPTGGSGVYTYSWLSSTTSGTNGFAVASGTANGQNYSASALTSSTWYRRLVSSGGCSDTSAAIKITVNPLIATNTLSGAQAICFGNTPSSLTGSTPTGGDGSTYAYSWLSSTTSATAGFSVASGTTNGQHYSASSLTATTWYRRLVTSGTCSDTSSAVQVTVNPVIAGNTASGAQIICSGSTPSTVAGALPTGGGGSYTYLWQKSTTSGSAGFSAAGGSNNTQNYIPSGSYTQNTWFRRVVNTSSCVDTSGSVQITVNSVLASNTLSGVQTICSGVTPSTLTGTTPTGGDGSFAYTWLSSTTSATSGFAAASGTNNALNYSPGSLTSTTWYRRLVTSGGCSDTAAAIQITVNPVIAGNTATGTQTICSGNTPSTIIGSIPTGGSGTYTYSWLNSTTGATSGFAVASGTSNGVGYSPSSLVINNWYRRLVSSGGCTDTSTSAAVTVTPSIAGNTIGSNQSILINTTPAPLTGSLPTGGTGTYTYAWISSTTSGTSGFAAAGGTNNTQGYTPGSLSVTTWYRRIVISGSCTDTSASVAISVNANLANNTISSPQTICSGSTPAGLTGLVPVGGTGTYVYTWLSSTTSATAGFAPASGTNNTQNYAPGSLTQTTWYRRYVTSSPASDTSVAIVITVNIAVSGNTSSGVQTICNGSTPSQISGSTPAGGNGTTYSFRWVKSTTSATAGFANAGGNDSTQNYQPGSLTATTWYRREVTSGVCSADTTTAVQVTVSPVLAANTASGTQTICTGSTPSQITGSTPTGGSGTYTYTWLSSTVSASTGFAAAGGTNNAANYQPGSLTTTTWYRRYVTSGGCTDTSAAALVTVNPIIVGNTGTGTQTICSGSTPSAITGSTPTGGSGTYTYSWLSSTTSATAGFAVAGGTNNTINYTPGTLLLSTWYRRLASSGGCTDTSVAVAVTVNPVLAGNTATSAQAICSGSTPSALTGSTPTGGGGTYAYSWLSSTTSATAGFAVASGISNGQNYSSSSLTASTWYRRLVTSGGCTDTSTAVAITVNPVIAGNTGSGTQTICSGSTPSQIAGSTPTGGGGTYTYSWLSSVTGASSGFATASGTNNTSSYSPSSLTSNTWYRRLVTSGGCTDTSVAVPVTVNPVIAGNTATGTQAICSGSTPSAITGSTPTGGSGTYTYSWLSSTTSATAGYAVASGTNNTISYAPGTLLLSTWYRRLASSGGCTDTSAAAAVTVNTTIAGNTASGAQTICSGSAPGAITGSIPTGGNGSTYTYSWLSSTTSATSGFALAGGTNNAQNYSASGLTQTTWFRRRVVSGACNADTSAAVQVTVTVAIAGNTATGVQTICSGSTPAPITGSTPTGGNGTTYTYRWLKSTTSATSGYANAGLNDSAISYTSSSLTATTWFRRMVTSGACSSDTAAAVMVTVTNAIAGNTATGVQTICSGSTPAPITGSTPTGGNGSTYTYRWLKSTTSATSGYANAGLNDSAISYTSSSLTATTWFRRRVVSGACNADTTAAVMVTVTNAIANNTATGVQTICSGSTPAPITGSTPTGGNGSTYTYRWLKSTTGATSGYANAGLNDSAISYTSSSLTATTWFRRMVTSGACSSDTAAAVMVTVTNAIAGNTATGVQTICSGSTPAPITGSTPTGGNGTTYTYRWLKSTTSATSGYANAGLNDSAISYTSSSLTATTWFRRMVTSGACSSDTAAAVMVTVTNAIAGNTATGVQTICSGSTPAPITGSTPTGGNGSTYTYRWLKSTTGATSGYANAGLNDSAISYTSASLTATTWFRRRVVSGACNADTAAAVMVTVTNAIANNTSTGVQTICNGNAPSLLTGSTPTGGNGSTYTYKWLKSTTSATSGYANAGLNDSAISYTSSALTASTWFRRVVTSGVCAMDTSAAVMVTVNNTNTWTGTTSTAWATVTNWGCGRVPVTTDSVVIVTATNQPIVIDGGRVSNSLTIGTGASLTINNAASQLTIGGIYTNNGTLTHGAGEIVFGGTFNQNIPAGTYNKVTVNNAAGVTVTGNATLNDSLKLTNGSVKLGSNNLTITGTTAIVSNASATRYVQTNGSGNLVIQNIGSTGRTGAIVFPVGNTTYNPFTLTNTGTTDNFTMRVVDSVSNTPTGPKLTAGAVGRTWLVTEGVTGGSNATIVMQWNAADELGGFARASSYAAYYNGTTWMSTTATAATGTNPYTQTRSAISTFAAFGVGSGGTLPVNLISFTGNRKSDNVELTWTTANELNNDHFVIERSTDAVNFTYAGTVKGKGTSSMMNNYNLTDNVSSLMSQKIPMVYYRLTQVDINGSASEGGIVAVNIANITSGITVNAEPNPFNTNVTVRINIAEEENITIQLTDMTGRLITEQITNAKAGENSVEMTNIDHLKDGMYLINVISKQGTVTHKVVKQN